jgi:8-oxo-dGTP diphosphatase
MQSESARPAIRIAAVVIRDEQGHFLLVRKRGTAAFMQAGGKIEPGEEPPAALSRELNEELGLVAEAGDAQYLGSYEAEAANEPGYVVQAELFAIALNGEIAPAAEIAEVIWLNPLSPTLPLLAPLTRQHVLRLD